MNEVLRDDIEKRLTLNWLIQGAAQHAGMTFHHLVREELNALDPRLLRLYDQYALINLLQYWHPDAVILLGSPPRFWKRATADPNHPFFGHPLLSKHGGTLAEAGRLRALERCKEKGLARLPVAFQFQAVFLISRLRTLEAPHRPRLVQLAKAATLSIWGIPSDRLDGDLVGRVAPGSRIRARSFRGLVMQASITGLGGVERRGDRLMVVARGTNWQLLAKELVKGTAELICLHGLNQLSDDTYQRVIEATDRLELEPWMLQSGGELWRRLLAVAPAKRPLAQMLMHLARSPVSTLESLIAAVIERPEQAQELLAGLGDVDTRLCRTCDATSGQGGGLGI